MKCCKTPASSRLEGPAGLHILPGGQQSPRARQERSGLPPKCQGPLYRLLGRYWGQLEHGGRHAPMRGLTRHSTHRCTDAQVHRNRTLHLGNVNVTRSRRAIEGSSDGEADEPLLAVKGSVHDFISSLCTSGKKGNWAGCGYEVPIISLRGLGSGRCARLQFDACGDTGKAWQSVLGQIQPRHPEWGSPAKSSFSEDDCPSAVAAIENLILYRRAE